MLFLGIKSEQKVTKREQFVLSLIHRGDSTIVKNIMGYHSTADH